MDPALALTLSVASVLMFIVPFEGMAKMVWIAIAYNLYYAVAYPIYNTANSTMIPVSTVTASSAVRWLPSPTWRVWALWAAARWYS